MNNFIMVVIVLVLCTGSFVEKTEGGILAYGTCQTGCNSLCVTCVAAAGGIAGVSTGGAAVPAAILACNVGQGTCMAACGAAGLTPTP